MKALLITSACCMDEDQEFADGSIVGRSHATGFGPGGEFTACGFDTASYQLEAEPSPYVDCDGCITEMNEMVAQCKKFKVKKVEG